MCLPMILSTTSFQDFPPAVSPLIFQFLVKDPKINPSLCQRLCLCICSCLYELLTSCTYLTWKPHPETESLPAFDNTDSPDLHFHSCSIAQSQLSLRSVPHSYTYHDHSRLQFVIFWLTALPLSPPHTPTHQCPIFPTAV